MSSTKIETNLDFRQNQALNLVKHNLPTAPSTPKEGQEYYNTATKKAGYWNGETWVYDIVIATDAQIETGTDETVAVNAKQLKTALDKKQNELGYIPEDLENKTTTLSPNSTNEQYASAKTIYDNLSLKAPLNSPVFTGTPVAPTPITGDSSLQIANTAFVTGAINNIITGAMIYGGAWDTTNATDYSALNSFRPIKKGTVFRCTGSGTTIDGVNYNNSDTIIFNRDISTTTTIITAAIDHYDHSLNEDVVLKDANQELTNKTINADNNTISNIELENFKSGIVRTAISSTPSDLYLLTEKAIDTELDKKAPLVSPAFTGTPTAPTKDMSDSSTAIATTEYVTNKISEATSGSLKKEAYQNPLVSPVNGVCTWTINHTLGTTDIICRITEVSTGNEVIMSKQSTSSTVFTITFNADAAVSSNTYKAVLIGV